MPEENKAGPQEEPRWDPEQLAMLKCGSDAKNMIRWNKWRNACPTDKIRLQGADLWGTNLQGANLEGASLQGAQLGFANLQGVNLVGANLQGAELHLANLQGANLWKADLQGATLVRANLQGATLVKANLQEADLWEADLQEAILVKANLRGASLGLANFRKAKLSMTNFSGTDTSNVIFDRKTLCARTNINNGHINPLFKRHVEDGNYLYEFKQSHKVVYWIWWILADCGRSFFRWVCWSVGLAIIFGCVFFYMLGFDAFQVDRLDWNLSTMLYYSVVTFTTLGFGDITPNTNEAAWWVMAEVIVGYVMLGGLISILANKLARRS